MSEDEQDEFSAAMKNPYRYITHTCSVEDTIRIRIRNTFKK